MDSELRIVLIDPLKGKPKVLLFAADDAERAEKAYELAAGDEENECVRMFIYPAPMQITHPAANAELIVKTAEQNAAAAEARKNAAVEKAKLAREQAEKDLAEAVAAHEALVPKTDEKNPE